MSGQALIEVTGASKRFGSFTAVADADLRLEPGQIVGLLGANGAGKTTLIRMIIGLAAADGGEVRVFGAEPSRRSRARLGYMPQGLGLYQELSVGENADFVASAFGVDPPPPLPPTLAALRSRPVAEIGLGLQRQLAFHCALLHSPRLLILDEPTSGVDPLVRARLWDTIHEQAAAGVGVLVTTHYLQEAEQCDRLELMAQGRIVAAGRLGDIVKDRVAIVVHAARWQDAFEACTAAGLPVSLAGRTVRVAGGERAHVEAAVAGLGATVTIEPATLEEVMVLIAADSAAPQTAAPGGA